MVVKVLTVGRCYDCPHRKQLSYPPHVFMKPICTWVFPYKEIDKEEDGIPEWCLLLDLEVVKT